MQKEERYKRHRQKPRHRERNRHPERSDARDPAASGQCLGPGCTRPAIHSDIDHTTAWHDGGKTSSDNLAALCRKHHTRKHRYGAGHGWQVRQTAPGVLEWLDPSGRRVTVTPEPVPTAVQLTSADTPPEAAKSQGPPGSVPEPEPRPDPWQAMEDWHVDGDDEDPPPY